MDFSFREFHSIETDQMAGNYHSVTISPLAPTSLISSPHLNSIP